MTEFEIIKIAHYRLGYEKKVGYVNKNGLRDIFFYKKGININLRSDFSLVKIKDGEGKVYDLFHMEQWIDERRNTITKSLNKEEFVELNKDIIRDIKLRDYEI